MFEQELFKYVRDNFTTTTFPTLPIKYVNAEGQSAPYIVMYVLDANGDPETLCDEQFDSADSFVQFNIYANANDVAMALSVKRELDIFLTQIQTLTGTGVSYKINRTVHGSSPSAQTLDNGLAVDVLAKTFIYEKETL